jgi:cellulose synthase (UDP-forming)
MARVGWLLRFLFVCGLMALLYYFAWWFTDGITYSPWLILLFPIAAAYGLVQLLGNWIIYLRARQRPQLSCEQSDRTIDVFVTACGEPLELVERSLSAACAMTCAHRTWLLDDGHNPELEKMAVQLGAGYLVRSNRNNAKAGNLNAALRQTDGDIVVIFDVDHAPKRHFLSETVGYFANPKVGFVQVMLTFANEEESWVSKGAAETALDFYNPTSLGMDGMGGATLMGSNALIRREALASIDGYQPGLAEDLATSLCLQAAGWRSVYIAKPLAPGLAPPDLAAWFVQQFKWARGVFELLLTVYPRVFHNLTWGQRLSYAVRTTKYWIGPLVSVHLFATIFILIFGDFELRAIFHEYLRHIAPLAAADVAIRYVALKAWRHPSVQSTSFLRAVTLVYSTWPTYTVAWVMALTRVPLRFRATPKEAGGRLPVVWLAPQLAALLLLAVGLWYTVFVVRHRPSLLLAFALVQVLLQLRLLTAWLAGETMDTEQLSEAVEPRAFRLRG